MNKYANVLYMLRKLAADQQYATGGPLTGVIERKPSITGRIADGVKRGVRNFVKDPEGTINRGFDAAERAVTQGEADENRTADRITGIARTVGDRGSRFARFWAGAKAGAQARGRQLRDAVKGAASDINAAYEDEANKRGVK